MTDKEKTADGNGQDLAQIQQWMQAVVMHSDGIVAGIDDPATRAHINVSSDEVERVISRSRQCNSIERLAVYGNAYYARLIECLRECFPALCEAMGEETLDGFAFGYLQQYPSQSYTLAELGRNFPKYLQETRPRGARGADDQWPEFLIDLATLEWTYSEVFDGPGIEKAHLLTADDLKSIDVEEWPETRLEFVPCFRLLSLTYPVHEYVTQVRRNLPVQIPAAEPTWLAITRRDYIVRRNPISEPQFKLLSALAEGSTIGEAIETTVDSVEMDFDEFAASLQIWFQQWTVAGYFLRLLPPEASG